MDDREFVDQEADYGRLLNRAVDVYRDYIFLLTSLASQSSDALTGVSSWYIEASEVIELMSLNRTDSAQLPLPHEAAFSWLEDTLRDAAQWLGGLDQESDSQSISIEAKERLDNLSQGSRRTDQQLDQAYAWSSVFVEERS